MSLLDARPAPPPVDVPMTPLSAAGTLLWLLAYGILRLLRDQLAAVDREWWIDCAGYGVLLGLLGTAVMAVHDRHRRRDRRPRPGPDSDRAENAPS